MIDSAVKHVMELDAAGHKGIYVRCTTLKGVLKEGGRGKVEDSLMLPGFAADMDIAGPGHKPVKRGELPPDEDTCRRIIEATGLPEPTLWVHSGGGLYPWWMFEQPYDLSTPDALKAAIETSSMLHEVIARHAENLGWFYSTATKDLARVLRIPGTINRKVDNDPKPCHVIQPAAYNFYGANELGLAIEAAHAAMPAPKVIEPPRPAPVPRVEGSELRPGDDFNNRAHWGDILIPHGWTYMFSRGHTMYWRRPGKDSGEHSATTGLKGFGTEDRLYVFSDATEFMPNEPYSKHAAYTLLNHGGTGATHFASSTRDLRGQGYGGELPKFDKAFDATSLVRPAAQVPVGVQAVDDEQPAQAVTVVEANEALPVLGHDGLPVFTDDVYRSQPWDDMGLVSMYSSAFCPGLRYVNAMDEWRVWNGQRWVRDDRQLHQLAARKLATGLRDQGRKAEAEGHENAKGMKAAAGKLATMGKVMSLPKLARTDICMSSTPKDYDTHKYLVTVENGTLNLKTGKLDDFDPNLMLTKRIKAVYDPSADGPRTRAFLSEIQPDPEVLAYMQRLVGATMLGNADERVLPIVHGASGSGKSAFLEMLYHVLADFAAVADPTTLMPQPDNYQGPSEKLHSLMGTRFVKMSELPENASLNQALVKSITGSDTQKTRPLYGHPVEWDVEYVVWMATNNLPKITSTDGAIWKRVKPIHFPNVFVNEDGSVKSGAGDKDLGRQLAREEGSFVLNWIMQGIAEYLDKGLAEPAQIGAWLTGYRDEMDTTRQFMAEAQENGQIKVEEGLTVPARDLYKVYMAWTVEAQIKFPLSIKTFKQRMEVNGYEQIRAGTGMVWKGMGITGFIGAAQTPVSRNAGMEAWARQSGLRN
jgi:P4 family phage/plasmid primase-like protien